MWGRGLLAVSVVFLFLGVGQTAYPEDGPAPSDSIPAERQPGSSTRPHPRYELKITKQKDVTNWDSKITLSQRFSSKVSLNLNASLHTRETLTLNRSDANDGTSASLKYRLNENIRFSVNYNASVLAYRYDLSSNAPADRKKRESVTVTAQLSKKLMDDIDFDLKLTTGKTQNSYAAIRNSGSRHDIAASISYNAGKSLKMSATYTAQRMLLESRVDSSSIVVLKTSDRSMLQNLNFSLSYVILPGVNLSFNASANDQQKQYPEAREKKQETEKRSGRSASISSNFELFDRLTWDVSVSFDRSKNNFIVRTDRVGSTAKARISGNVKVRPWAGAILKLSGTRDVTRNEYNTPDTGRNLHKSVSLRYNQSIGERVDLNLTALSDIVSIMYDDKEANPKDRDLLSNRIEIGVTYTPLPRVTTRFGLDFSEEYQVYVKSASSANSRVKRKYHVSGSYDLKTVYNIKITQKYDIGASYTLYEFTKSNNVLVRNSDVSTTIQFPIRRGLALSLRHRYKYQDQGGYDEATGGYDRSSERESHRLDLSVRYAIGNHINLRFRQAYYIQHNWSYEDGKKKLDFITRATDMSGKVAMEYSFSRRTSISLVVERNWQEGTRVTEEFRRYWNVEVVASHVF